jgi:hypothetical protein
VLLLSLAACMSTTTVRVTVDNVAPPIDALWAGPIDGTALQLDAGPDVRLVLAVRQPGTNDRFLATDPDGLRLWDDDAPVVGDRTAELLVYDAGTEADETRGEGADQAERQAAPNTGAADPDADLRVVAGAVAGDDLSLAVEHLGGTTFRVSVTGASEGAIVGAAALTYRDELWFATGEPATSAFERLAEDADPEPLLTEIAPRVGVPAVFGHPWWAVAEDELAWFAEGAAASPAVEALAEDGDPAGLLAELSLAPGVRATGVVGTTVGNYNDQPAFPGQSYAFDVEVVEGDRLHVGFMFAQSNDVFLAFEPAGFPIDAFNADLLGLTLWNAGTEVDEPLGLGLSQAPRQSGPDVGEDEGGVVHRHDDDRYPPVSEIAVAQITFAEGP